ncbi:YebC/PmpR family DNA-binding transcriptional regulator, partial [Vibrio vulnificus]
VKTALNTEFPDLVIDVEEITFVPQNYSPVPEEDAEKFQKFLDMLDDCDDVQQVYHNAEM